MRQPANHTDRHKTGAKAFHTIMLRCMTGKHRSLNCLIDAHGNAQPRHGNLPQTATASNGNPQMQLSPQNTGMRTKHILQQALPRVTSSAFEALAYAVLQTA